VFLKASIPVEKVRVGEECRDSRSNSVLLVIKPQDHPIMNFTVPQRHVVLKNNLRFLKNDLVLVSASFGSDQFIFSFSIYLFVCLFIILVVLGIWPEGLVLGK
jgi:hypothetical protein